MESANAARPDYGVDAPGTIRRLIVLGAVILIAACFVGTVAVGPARFNLRPMLIFMGTGQIAGALLMLMYAKSGKFQHRERMLAIIEWRGDERVLDVGTGRGLLLVGAAKRVPRGRAVGIDLWRSDLSGNSADATLANARIAGVDGRVEVLTMDARAMTFPDASFEVVLSNLCLHNIPDVAGRQQACREIVRVLAPGGTALVSDFRCTDEYVGAFREAGLTVEQRGPFFADTFPPLRIVRAART